VFGWGALDWGITADRRRVAVSLSEGVYEPVQSPSHAQGLSSPSRTSPLPAAAPGLFEVTNARSLGCRRESQVGGTADSTWSEGPRAPTPLTSVSTCTDTRLSLHTAVAQHLKTSSPLVSAPACRRPTQFERPRAARVHAPAENAMALTPSGCARCTLAPR